MSKLAAQVNYLHGRNRQQWITAVPTYQRILYRSIYPGVDLQLQGAGSGMEYEWILHPGANPAQLRLTSIGAPLTLDHDGSLEIGAGPTAIRQGAPHAYQIINRRHRSVSAHYALVGHRWYLILGAYDHHRALVIDPTLQYTKVLSGSLDDGARGVAVDSGGNTYVAGFTQSDNFPTQAPVQPELHGDTDAFVTKLDPAGKIIYSTYLGGSRRDEATAVTVDAAGNVTVAGVTSSKDFPITVGAVRTQLAGGTCPSGGGSYVCDDAFVARLNAAGNALTYGTYLGGKAEDYATGLALTNDGHIVVVGSTDSSNFPVAAALQAHFRAKHCGLYSTVYPCSDAFVTELDTNGLRFSTFLGGKDEDEASGVAVDSTGRIYVTGDTSSTDFPTVHPLRSKKYGRCSFHANSGNCPHAFVSVVASDGTSLLFSTYLRGSGVDDGNGIAADAAGDAYVAGDTTSTDFPVVRGVQPAHHKDKCSGTAPHQPCPDAFITKVNTTAHAIVYSSRIGGTTEDAATAVTVDKRGDAYLAGYAGSYNFPVLHAVQRQTGTGYDAFILELAPRGNRAYYSTYLGGEGDDEAEAIALRAAGDVVVAGVTQSAHFPRKSKYNSAKRGLDAFVARIQTGSVQPAPLPCLLLYGEKGTGCTQSGQ